MSMVEAILTQHPVGQGGMMSGLLTIPGGRLHWVYDCGSNQKDALAREIANIVAVGDVDCLFLSHLDSDHVNGIDQLLASVSVQEVVLPYLNNVDRFLLAARDAKNGTLTGTTLAMLADIPAWFGERGVERVTFVDPHEDGDGGEGPGPDLPEGGGDIDGGREGQIRAKWSRSGDDLNQGTKHPTRSRGPIAQRMDMRATMALLPSYGPPLDWVLAPFAHRPSDDKFADFKAALLNAFGRDALNDGFWLSALTDLDKRKKLRDCYDVIWSDHNLVSMALYTGPIRADGWVEHQILHSRARFHGAYFSEVGWLGTGDMHLDVKVRRTSFLRHYDRLLPRVNVFGLPHHGSYLNFDSSLPSVVPSASQFVAASGPNSYDHPSKLVKRAVRYSGRKFVHVNHHTDKKLQWRHST